MDKAAKVSIEALQRIRNQRRDLMAGSSGTENARVQTKRERDSREWPEPKPLPNGLAPVEPFSSEFMPDVLALWVNDIADRLQCPLECVELDAPLVVHGDPLHLAGAEPQHA